MLWEKESSGTNDAMYVDVFASKKVEFEIESQDWMMMKEPVPKKSDVIALAKRKEGNKFFGLGEWYVAMELYNESLCYAEDGSEHISLALANRSACFLNMKLYTESMIDIEAAKSAGYPEHLMPKLSKRKIECMKFIEEGAQIADNFGKNLSFDPDEKFPCMADVLKIQREPNGDFCVIAKEDIGVGETIVVEETVNRCLVSRHGLMCDYCLKGDTNLIPCKKCTVAMFCSQQCQNALHKYECGMNIYNECNVNGLIKIILRSILWAINLFPNFDELMRFVERVNASDPAEHPDILNDRSSFDDLSKYWTYLKAIKVNQARCEKEDMVAFMVFEDLTSIIPYNTVFNANKLQRFIIHLILHHVQVYSHFSRNMSSPPNARNVSDVLYSRTELMSRFFKHCCGPNVLITGHGAISTYISIRPIKEGDELTISSCSFLSDEEKRVICKCARCEDKFLHSRTQQHPIIDLDLIEINMCRNRMTSYDKKQTDEVLAKCIAYLKKFNDIRWSDQIATVVNIFDKFSIYRSMGPVYRRLVLESPQTSS